jgi:hypothetical protein
MAGVRGPGIREQCNAIEECYELMLGYAAQGLRDDQGSGSGGQVREFMGRAVDAALGLSASYAQAVKQAGLQPAAPYEAFLKVLERDAQDAAAAMQLVLAQPSISSQLVDNLNASIHLRALLTDLFLIDEILRPQPLEANPAATS